MDTDMGSTDKGYNNEIKGLILIYDEEKDDLKFSLSQINEIEEIQSEKIKKINLTGKGGIYEFKIKFNKPINWANIIFQKKNIIFIDLTNFDSSNTTSLSNMFNQCEFLEYVDLTGLDTSKVTTMSYMFSKCYKLKEIKGLNTLNTSKVTDISNMFLECINIEYLDLSYLNISSITTMSWMFSGCTKLKKLNISNFVTNNNAGVYNMFYRINKECEISTDDKKIINAFNEGKNK